MISKYQDAILREAKRRGILLSAEEVSGMREIQCSPGKTLLQLSRGTKIVTACVVVDIVSIDEVYA